MQGARAGWMVERIEGFKEGVEPCDDSGFWITGNE